MGAKERIRWLETWDARTKAVEEFTMARNKLRTNAINNGWDKATYNKALGKLNVALSKTLKEIDN